MNHVTNLAELGIAHIESAVPAHLCDQINDDFLAFCRSNAEESDKFTLKTGRRSRLTNLHVGSEAARLAFCGVAEKLDELLGQKVAIYSSLYFEQSSEQPLHRDSPFFCTEPYGRYLGVWIALEDVSPMAGPLQYVAGGHMLDVGRDHSSVDAYQDAVSAACNGMERATITPRKGDVVVWHPELPHGGTPIQEPGKTRKSIVFHVCPEHAPVFGDDVFLQRRLPSKVREEKYVEIECGRMMFSVGYAAFARNN